MTHTLCLRLQNGGGYAESGKETRGELIVKWWVVRCDATHPHLGTRHCCSERGAGMSAAFRFDRHRKLLHPQAKATCLCLCLCL